MQGVFFYPERNFMDHLQIEYLKINEIIPYEKNPRRNDQAVESVAASIREFGFKVPIIIDSDNVIVCGHTRLKAAKKLKLQTVPCVRADDLTEEQIKAFRLADNKTSELAEWDLDLLQSELADIADLDLSLFGFTTGGPETAGGATGDELDLEDYGDERFECECPKCGFKFNRK
jgi:ParB family transcriptional regulator, chromosome partitioning protein